MECGSVWRVMVHGSCQCVEGDGVWRVMCVKRDGVRWVVVSGG